MPDPPIRDDLGGDVFHPIRGDRKANSGCGGIELRVHRGQRGNAHELPGQVDQRATAIAGVDRRAGLDRIVDPAVAVLALCDNAVQGADDPIRHRLDNAQRITVRQHLLADLQVVRVAERDGGQGLPITDLDHGEVVDGIVAPERRGDRLAITERDLDFGCARHDVIVGDDVPVPGQDHARAQAFADVGHFHDDGRDPADGLFAQLVAGRHRNATGAGGLASVAAGRICHARRTSGLARLCAEAAAGYCSAEETSDHQQQEAPPDRTQPGPQERRWISPRLHDDRPLRSS